MNQLFLLNLLFKSDSTTPSETEFPIPGTLTICIFAADVENFLVGGIAGVKRF